MASGKFVLRTWGTVILLLVASVPFVNYADQPRRLIGAAATLLAFLMIRSVSISQERNHDEIARKLDAVARTVGRPARTAPDERSTDAALAATQAAELLDQIRRARKHRRT